MDCHNGKVACVEPSVNSHSLCCKFRSLVVSLHYSFTLNLENTFFSPWKNVTFKVNNANFYTADCRTDCSENRSSDGANGNNRSGFCKTVSFNNLDSDSPEEFVDFFRESTATCNTGTEVCSKQSLKLSQNQQVAQPVKRPHKCPWDKEKNPPQTFFLWSKAGILTEHFALHSLVNDWNIYKEVEKLVYDSACFAHFLCDTIINSFENPWNSRNQVRIQFFEVSKQDWSYRFWVADCTTLNSNNVFTFTFKNVPNRKYVQCNISRIQEDTFLKFIKLSQEVVVSQHNTFGSTGRSWSKDDCCKVIAVSLFNFSFNSTRIVSAVFFSAFADSREECQFYTARFAGFHEFFFNTVFKTDDCLEWRKFVFNWNNFIYLSTVFCNNDFGFCNRKDFFQVAESSIASARNINCANTHETNISLKPFCAVIRNESDFVFAFYPHFHKPGTKVQRNLEHFTIKNRFKIAVWKAFVLTVVFSKVYRSFLKHFWNCKFRSEVHVFLRHKFIMTFS